MIRNKCFVNIFNVEEDIEVNRLKEEHPCFECGKPTKNYFPAIESACCEQECADKFWLEYFEAQKK